MVNLPYKGEGGLLSVSTNILRPSLLLSNRHFRQQTDIDIICMYLNIQYLRMLAVTYEKTQELARDLQSVGCGDLDVEGNELTLNPIAQFLA